MFRCTSTLNETLNEVSPQDSLTSRFRSILLGYWAFYALVLFRLNTANIRISRTSRLKVHAYRRELFCRLLICWSLGGNQNGNRHRNGCTPFFYNDEKNYFYYTNTFYCQYCFCRITFTRISKWRIWKNDGTSKDG